MTETADWVSRYGDVAVPLALAAERDWIVPTTRSGHQSPTTYYASTKTIHLLDANGFLDASGQLTDRGRRLGRQIADAFRREHEECRKRNRQRLSREAGSPQGGLSALSYDARYRTPA